jgi:hypothetical protein|tara:strand:- start:444 stop:671 length:228 start_codon:yes stop_codon:yes gene_type:complete
MKKRLIIFPAIFITIFAYVYFLEIFFAKYLWMFFAIFVYLVFFIAYDLRVKRREINERVAIKDRKNVKISCWKCF